MKKIRTDNNASAWPVVVFILALAITSFLILILGHVAEPFLNLMDSTDTTIDENILAPRNAMLWFWQLFWPKGLLITIFIGLSLALFMEYQKKQYKET